MIEGLAVGLHNWISPDVRTLCAKTLGEFQATAPTALARLEWASKNDDKRPRLAAIEALSRIASIEDRSRICNALWPRWLLHRPANSEQVKALSLQLLKSDRYYATHDERQNVLSTLGHLGCWAKDAGPALCSVLLSREHAIRASWAIGQQGSAAVDAVPFLLSALKGRIQRDSFDSGDSLDVQIAAARAIGEIGISVQQHADAVRELHLISEDEQKDRTLRDEARVALLKAGALPPHVAVL